MKSKGNIVFLGMMGSGKTSIGKLVSKKLKVNFFDIDHIIENKTKTTISKIFSTKGEIFFRQLEEKVTLNILKKKDSVISLGGGAFLNDKVRKEILINHTSFWLRYDNKILIDRIKDSAKRPIAFNLNKDELVNLIKKRSNIYSKALYKVNCNDLKKIEIVNKILKIYEANKIKD
tara:strand:+ start:46 stop:570 length:525 start_codon:yes stop_codon:yes gene_type:complete